MTSPARRFRCSQCKTVFSVSANALGANGYESRCEICGRKISVYIVASDSGGEVLETAGCEPIRKDFPDEVSRWIADSAEHPSTAEPAAETPLAGGVDPAALERAREEKRRTGEAWRKKRFLRKMSLVFTVVTLAGAAAALPWWIRLWRLHEGKIFVGTLLANITPQNPAEADGRLERGGKLLRQNDERLLTRAASEFLKALESRPQDPDILSGLAETWTEMGAFRKNPEEYVRAGILVRYAGALDGDRVSVKRAEARLLWRKGKPDPAIRTLESIQGSDPEIRAFIARISAEKGDYAKATLEISEALKQSPGNLAYLSTLAGIFEKQSKLNEAAGVLKQLEASAPDPRPYRDRLENLYRSAGDMEALENFYRKELSARAIKEDEDEETRYTLIQLLDRQERDAEVAQEALRYFARHPAGAHYALVREMYEAAIDSGAADRRVEARPQGGIVKNPRNIRTRRPRKR